MMPEPSSLSNQRYSWPWLRQRLFPRGTHLINWTSYIILIAMIVIQAIEPTTTVPWRYYTTLMALAGLLVMNILWDDIKRLFPSETSGDWAMMFLSAGLTFYVIGVGEMYTAIYVVFMVVAQVNATCPPRPAILFSLALAGMFMGLLILEGATAEETGQTALGLLIGLTFTITLSQVLLRYAEQTGRANRLLEQLREANQALLEAREKEKELTIAEERVRVARDLHDGLGHHLTALSIQLQAAEKLVRSNPDLASEAIGNARGEVQAALKEVRQSVAALRQTPVDVQDLPQAIARLVEETGQLAGLRAEFDLPDLPPGLNSAAAMTIFRTAQEGLTNIQRHAQQATWVCARLVYSEGWVQILIEDDGAGQPDCPDSQAGGPGRGFGLAGLRERANLLGGRLECGARPEGGFFIRLSLPLEAAP